MRHHLFGRTGLHVSPLGFGGAPIGFLETDRQRVGQVLNLLLDTGVNVIDTAAMYAGSETLIGEAVGHRREEYVLVSKCGQAIEESDAPAWSAAVIEATINRALQRLRTDVLDVMLLHSCGLDVLERGEAIDALVRAREAGKIRFAGYSGDNEAAAWAARQPDIEVIETSVNLCDQANIETVLPVCEVHGVGVLAKRPIANAAWKRLADQEGVYQQYASDYTDRFAKMGLTLEALGVAGPPETAWPELALRFTLAQPAGPTAIVGTTRAANAERNLEAARKGPLDRQTVALIRDAFQNAQRASGETWPGLT